MARRASRRPPHPERGLVDPAAPVAPMGPRHRAAMSPSRRSERRNGGFCGKMEQKAGRQAQHTNTHPQTCFYSSVLPLGVGHHIFFKYTHRVIMHLIIVQHTGNIFRAWTSQNVSSINVGRSWWCCKIDGQEHLHTPPSFLFFLITLGISKVVPRKDEETHT